MIIDFVGAPGVGKSTFVQALADRLRDDGCEVNCVASYRPAEEHHVPQHSAAPGQLTAALRRLTRPATELIANAGGRSWKAREPGIAEQLMVLLPPRSFIWSIRLHQYLTRLAHSWRLASESDHIVLFDQGFVQAVASLVVLGHAADRQRVPCALDLIPAPDLLVHLGAPAEVLAARLSERQRRQGRLERLFELDLRTNLQFAPVISQLDELLRARSCRVAYADCAGEGSLSDEVDRIADKVIAMSSQKVTVQA